MSHLPEFRHNALHRSLVLLLVSGTSVFVSDVYANGLPPPPRSVAEVDQLFKLYLDLIVNQYPTQQVVPVIVKGDHYFIQQFKIKELQISIPKAAQQPQQEKTLTDLDVLTLGFSGTASDWIDLGQVAGLKYNYNSAQQHFSLDIPAEWMPVQMLGRDSWYKPETAESGIGLLNNYDFYSYRPETGGYNSTLFTEQRFFFALWCVKKLGHL